MLNLNGTFHRAATYLIGTSLALSAIVLPFNNTAHGYGGPHDKDYTNEQNSRDLKNYSRFIEMRRTPQNEDTQDYKQSSKEKIQKLIGKYTILRELSCHPNDLDIQSLTKETNIKEDDIISFIEETKKNGNILDGINNLDKAIDVWLQSHEDNHSKRGARRLSKQREKARKNHPVCAPQN